MEDAVIGFISNLHPIAALVLVFLGLLVVVAEAVVILTPTTKDDEFWGKVKAIPVLGPVLAALAKLAPIQKKPKE